MKSSGIGGQAVLEGVMMKNKDQYAVAVRKPDNEIAVEVKEYQGIGKGNKIIKAPIIRGVVAFADSMILGMRALTYSASFYEEEEEASKDSKKKEGVMSFFVVLLSICLAIGLFVALPMFLSELFAKFITSSILLGIIEGIIRVLLLVGYIVAISFMKDINRTFMYHGAEHKTINCIERGYDLTVANVRKQSRKHKRCGTSFILFVAFVSIIVFLFIRVDEIWLRIVLRVLLIPFVAGISYELIRYAGSHDNTLVTIISAPGMLMQRLTTKEPDDSMIEVAIASVDAVFDWKAYLDGMKQKSGKRKHAGKKGKGKNKNEDKRTEEPEEIATEVIAAVEENNMEQTPKNNNATKTSQKNQQAKQTVQAKKKQSEVKKNVVEAKKEEIAQATLENTVTEKESKPLESKGTESKEEFDNLDKLLFEKKEEFVEEKQNKLKERARVAEQPSLSSIEIAASLEPKEEEEDEILRALDKYFSTNKKEN